MAPTAGKHSRCACGWAMMILAAAAWNGLHVSRALSPDYLCGMCYLANILLAAGLMTGSAPLIGTGWGWALLALPLWAYHCSLTHQVFVSSIVLHVTGVGVGFLALRRILLPRWLLLPGLAAGLFSYLLARLCTRPEYNINAAFRVQTGWEALFPDYHVYLLVQLAAYALIFLLLPWAGNRLIYAGRRT